MEGEGRTGLLDTSARVLRVNTAWRKGVASYFRAALRKAKEGLKGTINKTVGGARVLEAVWI